MGFDLLIDHKLKPWILEVNDHPSLNIYFDKECMSHRVMSEENVCPLDFYVKSRVTRDTILLARKATISEIKSFNSLE